MCPVQCVTYVSGHSIHFKDLSDCACFILSFCCNGTVVLRRRFNGATQYRRKIFLRYWDLKVSENIYLRVQKYVHFAVYCGYRS